MKKEYLALFIVIFSLSLIGFVSSAPNITSVSGNLNNGNTITISGTNFGAKTTAAPLISSYDNPISANNWASGTLGGGWNFSNTSAMGLTNSNPLRSNLFQSGYKVSYDPSITTCPWQGGYCTLNYDYNSAPDNLYVSFWIYRDYSSWNILTGNGNNNKFLRIYGSLIGNHSDAVLTVHSSNDSGIGDAIDWGSGSSTNDSGDYSVITSTSCNAGRFSSHLWSTSSKNCVPSLNSWEHYEVYINYQSSPGSLDATPYSFKNGALISYSPNVSLDLMINNHNDARILRLGLVSGGMTQSIGHEYLDQIYMDDTFAHVFISNSSTVNWPNQNQFYHSEIQVAKSWNTNSINITLNQGSFANASTVYLYVVNSSGGISNPYPITIGTSSSNSGICEATSPGKCYYVSHNTGNDISGNGSYKNPWKTFANVISYYGSDDPNSTPQPSNWVNIQPGDIIYVMNGTYTETTNYNGSKCGMIFRFKNGNQNNWFTIKAYPGEKPIIQSDISRDGGVPIDILQSSYFIIDGLEISNSSHAGIYFDTVDNAIIRNNNIHDIDGTDDDNIAGIYIAGARNITVYNNTLHDNYDRYPNQIDEGTGLNVSGENSCDMVIFGGGNISVYNNYFYQTKPITERITGGCLKYKHSSVDGGAFKVYNNLFMNCKHLSIGSGTNNTLIENNLIINSDEISLKDFGGPTHNQNILIRKNTVYGGAGLGLYPSNYWDNGPKNISYKDNIIYDTYLNDYIQDRNFIDIGTYQSDSMYNLLIPEINFSNNCYYNPSQVIRFCLFCAGGGYGVLGTYYNLSTWKSLMNQDLNSIEANPLFVNITNLNFNLQSGSPCKTMGANISLVGPSGLVYIPPIEPPIQIINVTTMQKLLNSFGSFKSGGSLSDYITKIKEFIF
jgi:hypothetical protein